MAETPVPAVCKDCGTVFDSGLVLRDEGEWQAYGAGIAINRACPTCGGVGQMQEGVYLLVGGGLQILSGPEWSGENLRKLLDTVLGLWRTQADVSVVRHELRAHSSALGPLADALPKTRSELYAVLALLAAIIQIMISCHDEGEKSSVEIRQIFNTIIQQASESPPDLRTEGSGRHSDGPSGATDSFQGPHDP
jgi:hypothetical protein